MSQFDKPYLRLSDKITIKKGAPTRPHRKDDGITIPKPCLNLHPDYAFTERPDASARGAGYAIVAFAASIAVLIALIAVRMS